MLWQAFTELDDARGDPGTGIAPSDIMAWLDGYEIEGAERRGFYFRTIKKLDRRVLNRMHEKRRGK